MVALVDYFWRVALAQTLMIIVHEKVANQILKRVKISRSKNHIFKKLILSDSEFY